MIIYENNGLEKENLKWKSFKREKVKSLITKLNTKGRFDLVQSKRVIILTKHGHYLLKLLKLISKNMRMDKVRFEIRLVDVKILLNYKEQIDERKMQCKYLKKK